VVTSNDARSWVASQRRWLITADQIRVRAELRQAATPRRLVLVVAQGFSGSITKAINRRVLDRLQDRADVIAVELRGHGKSTGGSTLATEEIHEVQEAVAWARSLGYERVVTVGFSMGGAVVIRHAGLHGGVEAVVAVSPPAFWNYRGTPFMRRLHFGVDNPLGRLVVRHAMGTRIQKGSWPEPLSPADVAELIAPIPLLVVHGRRDEFFPEDHPRSIHSAADRGAKARGHDSHLNELWLEDEFGHAEASVSDDLLVRIADWADQAC
jgi:pimeloyl-ACP methyl ester carboxylesterase